MVSIKAPLSNQTVDVHIIDTTFRLINGRPAAFMSPIIKGFDSMNALAYSFLISHKDINRKETKLLFDLGAPKDWKNDLPPSVAQGVVKWERAGIEIKVEHYLSDIIKEHNIALGEIEAVIWSHPHWDHIGRPALFPSTTKLIVGPDIKSRLGPGFPENKDSPFRSEAFADREVVELSFDSGLTIGNLKAIDFFGDGSFFILDAPGHAVGHINALARTSTNPSTFIYMGGDSFHHCAALRPNEYTPLPESIEVPNLNPYPCPADLFSQFHPCATQGTASSSPFVIIGEKSPAIDVTAARDVVDKIKAFDADENVLVIAAHDWSLKEVVEFYPQSANDWKAKGWKQKGRWRFLVDFQKAVDLARRQKL